MRPVANAPDDEGVRVEIPDHVLRACYAARHMAAHRGDGKQTRHHMWPARRRFIWLLQQEMRLPQRLVPEKCGQERPRRSDLVAKAENHAELPARLVR